MTKDEAERMAKRMNNAPGGKKAVDGWRYEAAAHATPGGFGVFRRKGDAAARELYRSNLQ